MLTKPKISGEDVIAHIPKCVRDSHYSRSRLVDCFSPLHTLVVFVQTATAALAYKLIRRGCSPAHCCLYKYN